MTTAVLALVAGLALLIISAERFVHGAAGLARRLGVSTLMIGLTVVAFGTSAPELIVSATAALDGEPELAVGNAVGSNIANIGLVLGLAALVVPVEVHRQLIRREYLVMVAATLAALGCAADLELTRPEGIGLIVLLLAFGLYTVWRGRSLSRGDPDDLKPAEPQPPAAALAGPLAWTAGALLLLLASARLLVWGAEQIAAGLGVNEMLIGLTVVAVGTSIPEIATAIAAALRREPALVLGNIVGSNIFNILGVVGIAAAVHPATMPAGLVTRDGPALLLFTTLMLLYSLIGLRRGGIGRRSGLVLVAAYFGYIGLLVAGA